MLRVLCRGQVGGPAVGVVAAADHRAAVPHARFHLRQPTARFTGPPEEIAALSRQQQELLWKLYVRVAQPHGSTCRGDRRGHAAWTLSRRARGARLRPHRRDHFRPVAARAVAIGWPLVPRDGGVASVARCSRAAADCNASGGTHELERPHGDRPRRPNPRTYRQVLRGLYRPSLPRALPAPVRGDCRPGQGRRAVRSRRPAHGDHRANRDRTAARRARHLWPEPPLGDGSAAGWPSRPGGPTRCHRSAPR